jgi:WD40 repeat protein
MSQDGTIFMWLIETGQKIKSLNQLHGPNAELSCLDIDESNTKIYTAGNDGTARVFFFRILFFYLELIN